MVNLYPLSPLRLWEPGGSSGLFSPEEDCTAFAVDAIDRAEEQILVSAYTLTTGSSLDTSVQSRLRRSTVEALIQARRRGVDVRIIADRSTPCERKGGLDPLAQAGVPIWIDRGVRIAHSKSMVIDNKVTLTGSMNWTGGASHNSENLNLVASTDHRSRLCRALASTPCVVGALFAARRLVQERRCGRFQFRIVAEMRTEQRDRLEAGGFLRQPRKCPPESLQRGRDHPFRLSLDIFLIRRTVNCSVLLTVGFFAPSLEHDSRLPSRAEPLIPDCTKP